MQRPPFYLLGLLSCFLTGLGCSAKTPSEIDRPRHLLLITLDTLRADRLGSYGYSAAQTPHLDALADRGLRFTRAASVAPLTLPAHSSLMTGTFPAYHGVRDNGGFYLEDSQLTLAERLAAAGFDTAGFVAAFVLDSRWGIGQGFGHYFDDFDLSRFEGAAGMDAIQRPGSEVVDRALEWLGQPREDPFFAWVHLYDPHTPYAAPEPFRSRFPATRDGAYDAEIAAVDHQVGRLIDALEAAGKLQDTLIVVLADHGEMLGEHGEATHAFFIYEAATRIPLIVAGPGIPAGEVDALVRIVDVAPTVLSLLGQPPLEAAQGEDLAPLIHGGPLRLVSVAESWFPRFHYGWSELQSIQDGRYKLIRAPRRELYDLENDPGELNNLAEREPSRADDMEAALERFLDQMGGGEIPTPAAVDAETEERLRALGYLGSSASRRNLTEDRPRADPKDKIHLYHRMKVATAAAAAGELREAIDTMGEILGEDPDIVEAHMLLGNFHRQDGRLEEAIAAYRQALERDSEHSEALFSLAIAYKDLGRLDDALAGFERAAALDPRNGKVIWQTADALMRQGRLQAAEAKLLSALELDLDRPRFLVKLGECHLQQERFPEAAARLREALGENPELAAAHYHLGLAYEGLGQPGRAAEAYRAAVELSEEAYRASFNLAMILLKAQRPREAVVYFDQAVETATDFSRGYLYLAKARLDIDDLEGAEAAARQGLALDPDPEIAPLGHFVLADVYNRQGKTAEAAKEEATARRLQAAGAGS